MPVTIDIREDLRYQQGVEEGVEQKAIDTARRLLKKGLDVIFVQEATDLPMKQVEEIAKSVSKA